ncbi:MAG TPA: hypothetical protein VGE02_06700 [Gemmatimonadales bacterium]
MDILTLSRLNTAVMLPAVGLVAGHLVSPVRGVVLWGRLATFVLLMAAVGAFRGWREATLREPPARSPSTFAAAFALGAVLVSALGYVGFHGWPG